MKLILQTDGIIQLPQNILNTLSLHEGDLLQCMVLQDEIRLHSLSNRKIDTVLPDQSFPPKNKIETTCFQKFSLFINNNFIYFSNRKAEELVAYLVCQKGLPVAKSKIAALLWPDTPIEKSMNSLYKACQYIKKMSLRGIELPVFFYRDEIFMDISTIESDLKQFEQLYLLQEDIEAEESAVSLYKGPLFFDNCYEWSATEEAYYDIRFVALIERLVSHYHQQNNLDMVAYYSTKLIN